nr:MAG TPA: carbohydrate binding domain protein [Bacteriophage sp.]
MTKIIIIFFGYNGLTIYLNNIRFTVHFYY